MNSNVASPVAISSSIGKFNSYVGRTEFFKSSDERSRNKVVAAFRSADVVDRVLLFSCKQFSVAQDIAIKIVCGQKIRSGLSRCLALQRSSKPITDLHGGTKPRIVIDFSIKCKTSQTYNKLIFRTICNFFLCPANCS